MMTTIKTYATTIEGDIARIALDSAGIPALVVGVPAGMEGGLTKFRTTAKREAE